MNARTHSSRGATVTSRIWMGAAFSYIHVGWSQWGFCERVRDGDFGEAYCEVRESTL